MRQRPSSVPTAQCDADARSARVSTGIGITLPTTVLIVAAALSAPVSAASPSFDCAEADGSVEAVICTDDGLAALDRKLAEAYEVALKRASEDGYEDPRPVQRGWVKGRNDCSKAEDMRQCLETSYKERIAELQIQYGQMIVPSPIDWDCGDTGLTTVFYNETDPPTVVLTPAGPHEGPPQVIAFLTLAASGARYEGANVLFWEHHGEAMLTWFGSEMACRPHR